ncbi:MAG: hypothetical protein WA152_00630 [Microgenomates group bacterium]
MLKNKILVLPTLILLLGSLSYFGISTVLAQERIESPNYRIVFPNFNSGAGVPTSSSYELNTTIGQTAAGLFSSSGYRVKSGFQYINSIIPFSFSVSDIQINFGTLTPDTPSTDTSTLVVSAGGAGGYSVKVSENHPLQTADATETIIDTLCDTTCSETAAGVWTSTTKYGFGFNMSGDDVATDFTNNTYFRQFADRSNAESAASIMSSVNVGRERTATITYKVNVSDIQPAGTYQNIITFTAIPSY